MRSGAATIPRSRVVGRGHLPTQGEVVWSAPSTDRRCRFGPFSVLAVLLLVLGTNGATARSWSSLGQLTGRSGSVRYDPAPPSAPTGLKLTRVTRSALSLDWQPSRDNRRLRAYPLYRDGTYVGAAWRTSATVRGLACGRTYRIGVAALDFAGNRSEVAHVSSSTSPCANAATAKPPVAKPEPAKGASPRPVPPRTPPQPQPAPPAPRTPTQSPPTPPTRPTTPASGTELGVYEGPGDPGGVAAFGAWLGRTPVRVIEFLDHRRGWAGIEDPGWAMRAWAGTPYKLVLSVPLLPAGTGTLQQGAAGAYNASFDRLARALVAAGRGDSILRLGWEFNGDWMPWQARNDPAAYGAYWRQVVNTMRAVPGQAFKFDWCPNLGWAISEASYPGDAYVDYIGMDVYDPQGNWGGAWSTVQTFAWGLNWHRDFARARGKPMTFPEWGLWNQDNPGFIENMAAWIKQNNVAYHSYFNADVSARHQLEHFPQARARFQALLRSP